MTLSRPLALALSVLALSCATDPIGPPAKITALPRDLTAAERQIIAADNRFTIKLLQQSSLDTHNELENLFVSPLSVAMALAMTCNGAAGTTEEAMRTTLELDGMTVAEVNESYRGLIGMLRELDPGVEFLIANSIWYRQGFTIEQPFLDANRTYYDARVEALDFTSALAPTTINQWVSEQTHGVIPTIVDQIPDGMMMYLINAIYFKGAWRHQFSPQLTQPRTFRLAGGSTVNVPTMSHAGPVEMRGTFRAGLTILDLPYSGDAFSMTIVVPNDTTSIDTHVNALTPDQWNDWTESLQPFEAQVLLPKFTVENDLNLIPTLTTLGMGIAFDDLQADFTRAHQPRELFISEVKHKTYVDVNEEGTVAAAVTSVGAGVTSAPPTIAVDRPFLFALRENLSGTILFMGVIRHP